MGDNDKKKSTIEQAGDDLFNFAIERDDVKWLIAGLAKESTVKPTSVEYELQLLKIISVGWSISYFLEGTPKRKTALSQIFWEAINAFSKGLSETTELMIGQDIDYFEILKSRFDTFLAAMAENAEAKDPTAVIGPVFAELCGDQDDIFAVMAGSKLFNTTANRVRRYLEALKLR